MAHHRHSPSNPGARHRRSLSITSTASSQNSQSTASSILSRNSRKSKLTSQTSIESGLNGASPPRSRDPSPLPHHLRNQIITRPALFSKDEESITDTSDPDGVPGVAQSIVARKRDALTRTARAREEKLQNERDKNAEIERLRAQLAQLESSVALEKGHCKKIEAGELLLKRRGKQMKKADRRVVEAVQRQQQVAIAIENEKIGTLKQLQDEVGALDKEKRKIGKRMPVRAKYRGEIVPLDKEEWEKKTEAEKEMSIKSVHKKLDSKRKKALERIDEIDAEKILKDKRIEEIEGNHEMYSLRAERKVRNREREAEQSTERNLQALVFAEDVANRDLRDSDQEGLQMWVYKPAPIVPRSERKQKVVQREPSSDESGTGSDVSWSTRIRRQKRKQKKLPYYVSSTESPPTSSTDISSDEVEESENNSDYSEAPTLSSRSSDYR